MRADDVALALIEDRLASARERRLAAKVRRTRRKGRPGAVGREPEDVPR